MSNGCNFSFNSFFFFSLIALPINKDLLQAGTDEICSQLTVISSDCFNTLTVHLVICIRLCEVQTSVTLLVDEKVREVYLGRSKL